MPLNLRFCVKFLKNLLNEFFRQLFNDSSSRSFLLSPMKVLKALKLPIVEPPKLPDEFRIFLVEYHPWKRFTNCFRPNYLSKDQIWETASPLSSDSSPKAWNLLLRAHYNHSTSSPFAKIRVLKGKFIDNFCHKFSFPFPLNVT